MSYDSRDQIELFNFASGEFETVGTKVEIESDTQFEVLIDVATARFVEPGTGILRARSVWTPTGRLFSRWFVDVDYAAWELW